MHINLLHFCYISNNFSTCRQCVKHTYLKKSRLIEITVAGNCKRDNSNRGIVLYVR